MIVDSLKNLDIYKRISKNIFKGLLFLSKATADIEVGTYIINDKTKAIVSEYKTVELFERGYEAHKHVIDIQYPIKGLERVKWSPIDDMIVNIPYDENKDRTFFINPSPLGTEVIIGKGIFAIMLPNDGHSPQHFVNEPEMIKKIAIKISV